MVIAGFDIGGTKCAVSLGQIAQDGTIRLLDKVKFPTPEDYREALQQLGDALEALLQKSGVSSLKAIGISCGGPLDSKRGRILSPPNLPGWDHVDVITPFVERFGVPTALQNDANAGALAEWQWGAGKGCRNMVFLTFGTGMGAGLILNGELYTGTNDLAGEVGHIRLAEDGPEGYGKRGSFEGFCSGGGIARLAQSMAEDHLRQGKTTAFCPTLGDLPSITAQKVGEAAAQGDELALEVFAVVGKYLGRGLAVLVDILNPEKIVIGSIYLRRKSLLEPLMLTVLREEALSLAASVCEIVPPGLGEMVGDYASLSVAQYYLRGKDNGADWD
ncbi:MAG TPA: ROK family protein [Firmicutes bacterium]|jgi:glucokinase|nr:MAG: ROK family transcriptional regulator [Peptococcaceae bacterium 1109]HHT73424.1 ROK family protein [Bacillota bacterium]